MKGITVAKLTYQERKKMPKKEFALPGRRNKGKGGFPIPDKAHARAALQAAGGARSGKPLPPAEAAEVRRKVHAKFPSLGKPGKKAGK
jgi:hypothetical protein